jgi:hypothetical protein
MSRVWIGACVIAMLAGSRGLGVEPAGCMPCEDGVVKRCAPAGGWHPYGGGLLHWWNAHCFPCDGAPDDYCRKPLPRLCWPCYPPWYIFGPPEICHPACDSR